MKNEKNKIIMFNWFNLVVNDFVEIVDETYQKLQFKLFAINQLLLGFWDDVFCSVSVWSLLIRLSRFINLLMLIPTGVLKERFGLKMNEWIELKWINLGYISMTWMVEEIFTIPTN